MSKTIGPPITILDGQIKVELGERGIYALWSTLRKVQTEEDQESDEDWAAYEGAMDAVESLILAHACEGIDIASEAYVAGLRTTLEAISNNLG